MNAFIDGSAYFGILLSAIAYFAGCKLKRRFRSPLINPLLISILIVILFYSLTPLDFESYKNANGLLQYLLTPATICLAIPLYEKLPLLKQSAIPMFVGIACGVLANAAVILMLSALFRLGHTYYVTFLPKSVTAAIGIGISKELGGYESITVLAISITGILGNIMAEPVLKLFRITNPLAKGVGIGSASHVMGTTKALEMGESEGAASSLSIPVTGLLTAANCIAFSCFY